MPHTDRPKTHRGQNPRGDPGVIRQLNATMWGWGRGWMRGGAGVPPHLAAFIYISAAASNQANTGTQQGHTQMEIKQLVRFSFGRRGSNGPRVPAWFIICHFLSQHHCRELLRVCGNQQRESGYTRLFLPLFFFFKRSGAGRGLTCL